MNEAITYRDLKISTFEIIYIKKLKIEAKINEHTSMDLVAVIPTEINEADINSKCNTPIKIYTTDNNEIYYGIITELKIKKKSDFYELYIKSKSYTYMMDICRKKRSFQNVNKYLPELINEITRGYKNGVCNFMTKEEKINQLLVQYNETDWQFIKRIASLFNTGLVPHTTSEGVHYYFGIPDIEAKDINVFEYTLTKPIDEYERIKENFLYDLNENQYLNYEIKSYDLLELGQSTNCLEKELYVSNYKYEIIDGLLINTYNLRPKESLVECTIYNEALQGISLEGTIKNVRNDEIQVNLDIDKEQIQDAYYWFKYSTVAASPDGSGWYFMPEVKDRVRIYFPTVIDNDAFAISCIHKINADPSVKYISTIYGMKIIFSKEGIKISAKDNSTITLSSGGGISISSGSISVNASESISLRAEDKLLVSAKDNVQISCDQGGNVVLDQGGNVVLSGTKVKIN